MPGLNNARRTLLYVAPRRCCWLPCQRPPPASPPPRDRFHHGAVLASDRRGGESLLVCICTCWP